MKRATPNIADRLADRITTHTVSLMRFDADLRARVRRLLRQVERDIISQLYREDPTTIRRPTYRERRLIALAEQTQAILRTGYRGIAREHAVAMRELATIEDEFARTSIDRLVGAEVMTVGVSETVLREIARDTLIGGVDRKATALDWWAGQSDALAKRYAQAVRVGLAQGETIGDLVRRVRGTTVSRDGTRVVEGGVMKASYRDAESLVRTSVSAVSNAARLETYRANQDVVKGEQHLSTLDGRTTVICIALDGASWDFKGRPFPDSPYQKPNPGPLPLHWGERSVRIARLRSVADILGKAGERKAVRLAKLPQATRASMDGQVAATLTAAEWLARRESQGPEIANQILGRTRANLWRAGRLQIDQLLDQTGNPLTIEQLRRTVRGVTAKAIEGARAA